MLVVNERAAVAIPEQQLLGLPCGATVRRLLDATAALESDHSLVLEIDHSLLALRDLASLEEHMPIAFEVQELQQPERSREYLLDAGAA